MIYGEQYTDSWGVIHDKKWLISYFFLFWMAAADCMPTVGRRLTIFCKSSPPGCLNPIWYLETAAASCMNSASNKPLRMHGHQRMTTASLVFENDFASQLIFLAVLFATIWRLFPSYHAAYKRVTILQCLKHGRCWYSSLNAWQKFANHAVPLNMNDPTDS